MENNNNKNLHQQMIFHITILKLSEARTQSLYHIFYSGQWILLSESYGNQEIQKQNIRFSTETT